MKYFNEYLTALSKLIEFKSVEGKSEPYAPYGKEVKGAIDFFLDTAKNLGFKTKNYDGYAGEVTFGEGREIGIIGHVDVVPEGEGWNTPPYVLTEKDGYLCGRGVLDDKGPLLASLFALKELKDSGEKVNCKFRLFVGGNEETGWRDAEYLKAHANLPEYGFSPDGNFPVSYAEKGVLIVEFKLPELKNFCDLTGGTVFNAVCGYATVKPKFTPDSEKLKKFGLTYDDKKGIIESVGKSAHGSRPDLGKNAFLPLFEYMADCGEDLNDIIDCLFKDKGNLKNIKSEQGITTFSPNLVGKEDDGVYIKCDCRFPYPVETAELKKVFDSFDIPYKTSLKHTTQYSEKEGFLVKTLLKAYNSVTGGKAEPISQGGSTFARVFKKGVAFGPEFPDEPSTIHEPNERVKIEDLKKIYEIYEKAIFELAK
ncbi:MAG: Sapep family Mn(2+)-dependent dipeptidase [Clostridia bacterium]|nr:Sapep family Mn(2+)-dependent dipeptidase [Clostridia bacterium]